MTNLLMTNFQKELTELQHRYEETSKELSIAEKTLSSNKVKQLNKKLKTSKNTNKKIKQN